MGCWKMKHPFLLLKDLGRDFEGSLYQCTTLADTSERSMTNALGKFSKHLWRESQGELCFLPTNVHRMGLIHTVSPTAGLHVSPVNNDFKKFIQCGYYKLLQTLQL